MNTNYSYGQLGQPTAPGQGPAPAPKKGKKGKVALGVLGGLFVLGAFGAALDSGNTAADSQSTTPSTEKAAASYTYTAPTTAYVPPAATAPRVADAPKTSWTPGTYKVGKDLPVGEYKYTVDRKANGYWATCQDTACAVGAGMIDNDWIPTAGATGYLTVGEEMAYVEISGLTLTPAN